MNTLCRTIQEEIQTAIDNRSLLPEQVIVHLAACSECRQYEKLIRKVSMELPNIITEQSNKIAEVSFSGIAKKSKSKSIMKRIILSSSGIAAALVIGLGIFFGSVYVDHKAQHKLVMEETDIFVDALFEDTFLDSVDLSMADE